MSDAPIIHIGENSPEEVAYKLLKVSAYLDGFVLSGMGNKPTREWLLDTYSECLSAVKNPDARSP